MIKRIALIRNQYRTTNTQQLCLYNVHINNPRYDEEGQLLNITICLNNVNIK